MAGTEKAQTLLWLLRHPEPDAAARGRCYGAFDVPLSTEGIRAAYALAATLAPERLDAIYTSPLQRCADTAEILAEGRSSSLQRIEALREMNFGAWEGKTYEEIAALYPELYQQWMDRPTEIVFPGGECFREMRMRVLSALDRFLSEHAGQSLGLVTHGGVIRIILAEALRMQECDIFRLGQCYGAINLIRYIGDIPIVELMNATSLDRLDLPRWAGRLPEEL